MIYIKKWFTIVEIIITMSIAMILFWLWSLTIWNNISNQKISNKEDDIISFINGEKFLIPKQKTKNINFFISSESTKKDYIISYFDNWCNLNFDDLYLSWITINWWNIYFSWWILNSASIVWFYKKTLNSYEKMEGTLNFNIKDYHYYMFSIYNDGFNCGQLSMYNLNTSSEINSWDNYFIEKIDLYDNIWTVQNKNNIKLSYNETLSKAKIQVLNEQNFYNKMKIFIKNKNTIKSIEIK